VVVLAVLLLGGRQGCAQEAGKVAGRAAPDRANRLFGAHQYQESMNALDEALRLDPNLVPALTLRARLAMAADRYDVAKESLERAIAAEPSSWYPRFLYGFQFYHQNEMPAAIASFEKAREMNPRDPESALYLGLAYESVGRTEEALALYRRAIQLEGAAGKLHSETLLICSRLLLVLGEFEECGRMIERAAKVDTTSRDPHFEAGRLLLKKGDPAQAAKEGEIALGLNKGDVTDRQVHFLLVQAYRATGQDADAARHAAAVRALDQVQKK
jgi:tetratricopeptide (TPR) repeat protein